MKTRNPYKIYLLFAAFAALLMGTTVVSLGQVDTEFWFVVPELSHRGNTGGTPGTLRLSTLELEATVTVSMPANTWHPILNPTGFQDVVVNIPANSDAAIDLTHLIDDAANPTRDFLENKPLTPDGINNFGLHITSTNLINAYWEVNYVWGSDLWTLKGGNGMGTLFFTPFQTDYDNRAMTPLAYSAIDIVSTADNNQVTIYLPPGIAASYGSLVTPVLAGGTHTITLNRGQSFSIFPRNFSTAVGDRLAGTRIESTEDICVSTKDDALAVGSKGQAVIGDQLVPVEIVGDNYIVPDVKNPNYIYVVATEDNTALYVTNSDGDPILPTPYANLNRGEQVTVIVPNGSKYARLTTRTNPGDPAKPIYVYQSATTNQTRGGALVPPIGCTGNTQLSFTRARAGENIFYFFLITEKGNEDKFLIDGVRDDNIIDPGKFTEVVGSDGWVSLLTTSINANVLPIGQHLVENTGGIFHLAIMNGFPGAGQGGFYYGYYSDFGGLKIGATVAGTNSEVVRACYGDDVQLHAFGGTTYQWTPSTYLDDPTSNLPIAINLPPGPHNYTVEVSGACGTGVTDLTVLVASPIVAQVATNVTSGCSPLEIQFEDQSQGAFSWQYDLGDGSPLIRYDLNPATPYPPPPNYPDPITFNNTYTNTGNVPVDYTVTLLVKNESGCSDILTKTITVFPEINSAFTYDQDDSCDPLPVQFTNNSSGDTATWFWEFGDGGTTAERDPQHVFRNLLGPDNLVFETRLIAISPYFCRDTSSHLFTVRPYIEAKFAYDTVAACSPHEIIITDESIGADTYFWDFGDGTTSNSSGPVISKTYVNTTGAPVTYTITLRVDNEEGCTHQIQRDVTVYPELSAAFSVAPGMLCSPGEVAFTNNSTGAATYLWDFGDGGTSTEANPVHLYERNMTGQDTLFTVSLVATSTELCRDTATFEVLIKPYIEAAFTIEDVVGCHPFTVDIDNESIGVDVYFWDFGDGSPVSDSSGSTLSHTYLNTTGIPQVYTLELLVFNQEGCSDTLTRDITVLPEITANFTATAFDGCHPLTVTFTDLSVNAVNYLWDFGDGAGSTIPSPEHTFVNFGITDTVYTVRLTTSTADGTCVKSVSWPITVRPQVVAEFTFPDALGCGPFEVTFENLSIRGTDFTWDFGDGTVLDTASSASQTHTFINNDFINVQDFEVSLIARNASGCNSEIRKTVSVYPDILAGFSTTDTSGCHPLDVTFTNRTDGGGSFVWDFGDGAFSNDPDPDHIFTNSGNVDSVYTVRLVALAPNNVCRDTSVIDITVHPHVQASFNIPDRLGCPPFDVVLENSSLNGSLYHWDFGDGTDTTTLNTDPVSRRFVNSDFSNQQVYVITLEVESMAGCTDTVQRSITVEPDIDAGFGTSAIRGCHPLTVDFTNTTNGASYYHWDFGNGTTSLFTDPTQTFSNMGNSDTTYQVWLHAYAGNNVCRDSVSVDIVVHPFIQADFTFLEEVYCTPSPVVFNNASIGGASFLWVFDDGTDTTTTDLNPVSHVFSNSSFVNNAIYQVTLTAENAAGCTSQITRPVEVYPAIQALFSPNVAEGCHILDVDFSNQSNGGFTYAWDFGDGASSESEDPVHTFTNFTDDPITRQVRLIATSADYCTSEVTADITIHPKPRARFETSDIISCPPFDVSISNTSLNADLYNWDLGGDTLIETRSMTTFNHVFDNLTDDILSYDLNLVASSDFGCTDTVTHQVSVYPYTIAAFTSNDGGCTPFVAYFVNESVRGDRYLWDLGDGTSISVTDPSNVYFNFSGYDTVYHITLTSTSIHGCVDSITDSVDVYAQPHAEFSADPSDQEYPSATVSFTNLSNQGNWSYSWNMGDGFTSGMENPLPHTYDTWGSYEIDLAVASAHCSDSISHTIRIFPTLPVVEFDTVIPGCAPLTVRFRNNSLYGESYLWEFDDGSFSNDFEPVHTFENPGIYNVKLTVEGDGGRQYDYGLVEVYRMPYVDFSLVPDTVTMLVDEVRFFNLSNHGDTYLWDFGDGTTSTEEKPEHTYSRIGLYDVSLDVWTEHGCTDRLVKPALITVKGEGLILFPNAFKPDMDGPNGGYYDLNEPEKNNIFHPYWEGVMEYHLVIYDRWGEKLYYSNEVNRGWDGYHKGTLCAQAVYVFKSWGFFINGEPFIETGDVTLIYHDR